MKNKIKRNSVIAVVIVLAFLMQTLLAPISSNTASADEEHHPDPNFHIYIAFGQSNMEGNPAIEDQDKDIPDNYYMMQTADGHANRKVGEWYPAVPPLANSNSKLSIADYFGRGVLELKQSDNPDVKVGILVVAVAGSSIKGFDKDTYEDYYANAEGWMKNIAGQYGGNPYQRIIDMAKKAQQDGVIKGIIMHQGETDGGDRDWPNKVKKIYDDMITDLELGDNVPLLAGQVLSKGTNENIINRLPEKSNNFYVISSEGFVGGGDNLHFSSEENRQYGRRYAEKMVEVEPQYTFGEPVYEWSSDNTSVKAKRICNELPFYVEEETVSVTKAVTKEATTTEAGTIVYTSADFQNSAFTKQTKTETIPQLAASATSTPPAASATPTVNPTEGPGNVQEPVEKVLKLSSVVCKKNTRKITGKVSEKGVTVKIKVGKKAAKKAKVTGKKFTLKLSYKLKKKTKVKISVQKKNFKTVTKTYTVK